MNMRSLIIGIGALFIAVIAAVVARNMFATTSVQQVQAQPVKQEPKAKILVAVKALPMGTILKPEDVKYAEWPEGAMDATFLRDGASNPANMTGKVVKVAILAGQPLTTTSIVGPGERGFLAAVLKPGMRAVSVSVTATSGVSGFIFPGDRVDVVLTHEVTGGNGNVLRGSETILENVRVLAVDQMTSDTDRIAGLRSTVTVEAQPKYVELINVAQRLGQVSLSLRPLAQTDAEKADLNEKIDPVTGKPIVTADGSKAEEQEPKMPLLSERSLTVDKEFSKLVGFARVTPTGGAASPAAAPSGPAAGSDTLRPDMTVGRGEQQVPISFKTRIAKSSAPVASAAPQPAAAPAAAPAPIQQ
jgi:pilus assembly protein CpaB